MRLNCDYTSSTVHQFYQNCCVQDEFVSTQGVCSEKKLNNMIKDPSIQNKWTQFFIPEVIDIPSQKPDVDTISTVYSCIDIISQRVVKTPMLPDASLTNWEGTLLTGRKLVIEGILKQKIVYTAKVSEQSMHSAHFEIPFSVFIIIDENTSLSQTFKLDTCIEDIFTCKLSARSIFKNTTIFVKATPVC